MCLGILFPIWQVIVSLTILILIWNFFFYKIGKEDEEETPAFEKKPMEIAQHTQIPLVNTPIHRPYTPRNPPVPISAYQKSRQIMLEKK
jgi:hypothetical protein